MGAIVDIDPDTKELPLWGALRAAVRTMSDDFVRFVAANVAWLAVTGLAPLLGRIYPPGFVLLVLVVGASLGLCRMAACVVRGRPARSVS